MAGITQTTRMRNRIEGVGIGVASALILAIGHTGLLSVNADPRTILQPWLLANGYLQYTHIADEHAPLFPQLLAWIMPFFDYDPVSTLRVTHGLIIVVSVFLAIFWLVTVAGRWAGLAGAAYLLRFSAPFGYWGPWYNLALAPIYLLSFFLIARGRRSYNGRTALALGLLHGSAILIKQHAALLLIIGLIWLIIQSRADAKPLPRLLKLFAFYTIGSLIPVGGYLLYYLLQGGDLADLWYWSVTFNLTGGYRQLGGLTPSAAEIRRMLPAFVLVVPFVATLLQPGDDDQPGRLARLWLIVYLAIALIFQYPRYSTLHWAVALGFMAILSALVVTDWLRWAARFGQRSLHLRALYGALVALWLLQAVTIYWPYLRGQTQAQLVKYDHLFELAAAVEPRLPPDGGLVLMPDTEHVSNLYYLLDRPPPKFWIMSYPWLLTAEHNRRWIDTVEAEKPQTLLYFVDMVDLSASAPEIVDYIDEHYTVADSLTWDEGQVHIMQRVAP